MNRAEATSIVQDALTELIEQQPELLDFDVTERTISHHLANGIRRRVPADLHVDIEYNRRGADPKRLGLRGRKADDDDLRAVTVFPDIVVHKRGTDERNMLVLELKKPGGSLEYDAEKLRAFRGELNYQHAGHVVIGLDADEVVMRELIWVDE